MSPHDEWVIAKFGRNNDASVLELVSAYLNAIVLNEPLSASDVFRIMTIDNCITMAAVLAEPLAHRRENIDAALYAARATVVMSLFTPFAKIDFDDLTELLTRLDFNDLTISYEFIRLMRALMNHNVAWPKIKNTIFSTVERMLVFLELPDYLPVTNKRTLNLALVAGKKVYLRNEEPFKP
jgi:hypothetical protein